MTVMSQHTPAVSTCGETEHTLTLGYLVRIATAAAMLLVFNREPRAFIFVAGVGVRFGTRTGLFRGLAWGSLIA